MGSPAWTATCRRVGVSVFATCLLAARAAAENVTVDCVGSSGDYASLSAAVDYLNTKPALGGGWEAWDIILLKSDCTDNVRITRSHVWITPDVCWWPGCPDSTLRQITAAEPGKAVVQVEGPHDATLVHLKLKGGLNGLAITGGATVDAFGVVAEGNVVGADGGGGNGIFVDVGSYLNMGEGGASNNPGYGIYMSEGSSGILFGNAAWLQNVPLLVSHNSRGGMRIDRAQVLSWAGLRIEDNTGWGLLLLGADASFGSCCGVQTLVRNNSGGGIFASEGGEAGIWGNVAIRNNGPYGVHAETGGGVSFYSSDATGAVVEGHTEVGVDVTGKSHVSFRGPHKVRNNGQNLPRGVKPWIAGVRVDGGSHAYFGAGPLGTAPEITGYYGPGVLVDMGSVLDAAAATFTSYRSPTSVSAQINGNSTAYLGPGVVLGPRVEAALSCGGQSWVVATRREQYLYCLSLMVSAAPRPPRPEALQ